jgi:hypothetical protein
VLPLYTLTIFLAAGLLFLVQPLFARMALPLLGGAPAVWNTAMVFYQAALLAGYAYAHVATRVLGVRRQAALHLALLLLPLAVLPVRVPPGWHPPADANPVPWLLALLTVAVGLPFFATSATSPVLQAWFAATGHGAARDPYFLYAASNLGSMLALVAYPVVLERALALDAQSRLWGWGYGALVLLVGACAVALWRGRAAGARAGLGATAALDAAAAEAAAPPTVGRRARWVLLAFVPSSLLLSVTTYLSTDIAAIPLLWVVPLAIYLLTFILVFGRRRLVPHRVWVELLPLAMLPLVLVLVARANEPLAVVLPTHLVAFFVAAMVCHGELAADRPHARHLTGFYLWLSLGGVLGGAFTALAAPLLFSSVAEYPLVLVLVPLLPARPPGAWQGRLARVLDVALPLGLGALALGVMRALDRGALEAEWLGPAAGLLALACLVFARRPLRFALGLAAVFLAGAAHPGQEGTLLYAERSFFGVSRVTRDPTGQYHRLMHGTTLHGMQALDPARRREPLTYFHPSGPLGEFFAAVDGPARPRAVAVVGLGAGSLACYGQPGERWTFYEIDPTVLRIAGDPRFFTFLRDCPPGPVAVRLGDARLMLDRAPDGLLLFNASNRHLVLEPVLGAIARAAGLVARTQDDAHVSDAERRLGKVESQWVVMARRPEDLRALRDHPRWTVPRVPPDAAPWTDGFASLLSAFRWR